MENKLHLRDYNKYVKYKNKYLALKNTINIQRGGTDRIVTRLRHSICDQTASVMSYLNNVLLNKQQSSLWLGTDFYHVFGNRNEINKLGIEQLSYMISSISNKYMDASYSAKVGLIQDGINIINTLKDSLKRVESHLKINTIGDINELNHYCKNGNVPKNFRTNIQVHEVERDDGGDGPIFGIPPSGGSKVPPYNSTDTRCVYRDPKCIGDKDTITLDDINRNNISNVVRVDKKCYDADELQKWLVNNPTLPHNRQKYTSNDLNKCVEGRITNNIPPPTSNPYFPPVSNSYIDPYALTDPYAPYAPSYAQPSYAQPSYAQPSYAQPSYNTPIIINSEKDDSSSESSDESINEREYDGPITKIEIQPVKGKKITYTKHGTFELKKGKTKDLEIHINNKRTYFIKIETKKKSVVNLFYNEDEKSKDGSYKVKEIKSITIEDTDNKIKINYNTTPIKKLLQKIDEAIKKVSGYSNSDREDLSF